MKALILAVALAAGAAKACGPQTVKGVPTKDCPAGEWIVERDAQTETVTLTCNAAPSPKPTPDCGPGACWSPTAGPHGTSGCYPCASPTPSPEPLPTPSASPVPSPTAPPRPSPTPLPFPSPSPLASPSPSPISSPAPSPSPTPSPIVLEGGNFPVPAAGTCPKHFDHPAVRINLGDAPNKPRIDRGRAIFVFNVKPVDVPPWCGHRPNDAECEQWAPCAEMQDRVYGEGPMWWFAGYPGTGCNRLSWREDNCQVEHPSRPCDADEKAEDAAKGLDPSACARGDAFHGRDVVDPSGGNGGPPGRREICVAPHGSPEKRVCHAWDLQADGSWRLLE